MTVKTLDFTQPQTGKYTQDELQSAPELNNAVPYGSKLSFVPLLKFIEDRAKGGNVAEKEIARIVLEKAKEIPSLWEPITDHSLLDEHQDLVDLMFMAIIPPSFRENELMKVSAPWRMDACYATPKLEGLMKKKMVQYKFSQSSETLLYDSIIRSCTYILNKYYGQELPIGLFPTVSIQHPGQKLKRHYQVKIDTHFVEIKKLKPLKPLSKDQISQLLSNIYDIELWLELLPPENFEFQGLIIGHLQDVTEQEILSQLKQKLLEKSAVLYPENIKGLEHMMKGYFNSADLQLGLTAIDYPRENVIAHKYKIRFDFLAEEQEALLDIKNNNSVYEKVCKYREILLIEDLEKVSNATPIEKGLLEKGFRSIIVAPLFNKDKQVIGLLEIGSPNPYELNSFTELKLKGIIDLFSMAMERSREEVDNRVEAIIREQYTAVHPSVEWKFIETAYNLLEKRETNPGNAVPDPIVFKDVFPLYGQADIVSSSTKRNHSIQADLIDNLSRAKKALEDMCKIIDFPLARKYARKVEKNLECLKKEFNSNDESRIVELLQGEVHPLIYDCHRRYPQLADVLMTYINALDPELQIIYNERKDYEDSVAIINNVIGNYLEQRQKEAQKLLPHYFEKYKTDGVEYDIYVGQSLLKKERFTPLHLQNFRLWQLYDMCEITRRVHEIGPTLPVPLTTAQLIFAYSTALSIRFRMDEKQFDVDGAYNVRYEILKKRIDKAVIDGTEERLTVAGKVAIVYLQEKERLEYLEYIEFLKAEGLVEGEIEQLRLANLQGVQGLRALRFKVKV